MKKVSRAQESYTNLNFANLTKDEDDIASRVIRDEATKAEREEGFGETRAERARRNSLKFIHDLRKCSRNPESCEFCAAEAGPSNIIQFPRR